MLEYIPDHLKNREMGQEAVVEDPLLLRHVLDLFVTHQQVKNGMMTIIIAMMMALLSGTMVIKNTGPIRPQQKKSSYPLLGTHQGNGIGNSVKQGDLVQFGCL